MTATAETSKRARYIRPGVLLRDEKGGRFQLQAGHHFGVGPPGCKCDGCAVPTQVVVKASPQSLGELSEAQLASAAEGLGISIEGMSRKDAIKRLCEGAGFREIGFVMRGQQHTYEAYMPHLHGPREEYTNDIVESDCDLQARFGIQKFVRLTDAQMAPPKPLALEKLTIPQLLAHAEEEEIDLKGAAKKEDIIKAIREATSK